jgi:hypothetical protein
MLTMNCLTNVNMDRGGGGGELLLESMNDSHKFPRRKQMLTGHAQCPWRQVFKCLLLISRSVNIILDTVRLFTEHTSRKLRAWPRHQNGKFCKQRCCCGVQRILGAIARGWSSNSGEGVSSITQRPASYPMGSVEKRPEREADRSPPTNAEIESGRALPPLPHTSL